jgi:hypothetical protein
MRNDNLKARTKTVCCILIALIVSLILSPFVYAGDRLSFHSGGRFYPIYKSPSCWLFEIGFAYWAEILQTKMNVNPLNA